jgi:hypothetical protein
MGRGLRVKTVPIFLTKQFSIMYTITILAIIAGAALLAYFAGKDGITKENYYSIVNH